jgi:hypothetical protein
MCAEDQPRDRSVASLFAEEAPSEPRPVTPARYESTTFAHQARILALHHGERILDEIPTTLRRVGRFVLVMTITIPVFLAGLLLVLWHLAR